MRGYTGWNDQGYPPGDVVAQTRLTIEKIQATLAAAGLGLEDVVESFVYISDSRYFTQMSNTYRDLMPMPRPARTTVEAVLVVPAGLVEIMVVADAEDASLP